MKDLWRLYLNLRLLNCEYLDSLGCWYKWIPHCWVKDCLDNAFVFVVSTPLANMHQEFTCVPGSGDLVHEDLGFLLSDFFGMWWNLYCNVLKMCVLIAEWHQLLKTTRFSVLCTCVYVCSIKLCCLGNDAQFHSFISRNTPKECYILKN